MATVFGGSLGQAAALSRPFLPGDIVKVVVAGFVTSGLARARPDSVLSVRG